jgi:hypothetical protein
VSPRLPDPPTFWIIAGANGSGKSSAYDRMFIEAPKGSVWIINPDLLSARIRDHENLEPREVVQRTPLVPSSSGRGGDSRQLGRRAGPRGKQDR